MNLKKQFVNAFIEEVERLNGTEFEDIGRYVMELITNQELVQKGHNPHGKPVGYTVDYEQVDRVTLVGQSGTDSDYFTKGQKPLDDIESSLKNCPNCKTVYLFSNQRATGGDLVKIKDDAIKKYPKIKARIYDAEKIAEIVYEKIFCEYKVNKILNHLPKAYFYYKMYVHGHSLPSLPSDYVSRKEEEVVCNILQKENFIQIYGLSGIGKTSLAIAVSERLYKSFNTVIWIAGENVNENNLTSVQLKGIDQQVNLDVILSNLKCLVIIDNLNNDVARIREKIAGYNKKGSKCIVTSLQKSIESDACFQLNVLPKESAAVLIANGQNKPTEEQVELLIGRIGGYPLLIHLAKSSVDSGDFSWNEIVEISELTEIEDEHYGITFARRIVGKYVEKYPELFNIISILDKTRICKSLIREFNHIQYKYVVKASVLEENELYYCNMHSIVLESVKVLVKETNTDLFLRLLSKYLDEYLLLRGSELYTLMAAHLSIIESLQEGLPADDMLRHKMALACIYDQNTSNDFEKHLGMIDNLKLSANTCLVDLLLEAERKEILISKIYKETNDDKARIDESYKAIAYFEKIFKAISTNELKSVCQHHIAKWKNNIDKQDEAEALYHKVLEYDAMSYRTRLQLARIYNRKKDYDKVYEQTDIILGDASKNGNVPFSVVLSVYDLLSKSNHSKKMLEYLDRNMELLTNTIEASVSCHNAQVYYVLSNMSGTLAYNYSDIYNTMCSSLPPVVDVNHDRRLTYLYANILTRLFQYVITEEETREMIYQRALALLTSIQLKDDYERRTLMNLYIGHNEGFEALKIANQCDDKDNIYLNQTKAKAYIVCGQYKDALQCIDISISNEADCHNGHKAAFRHDKAIALYRLKDIKCLEWMDDAIRLQDNKNTKNDWIAEMDDMKKGLSKDNANQEAKF